MQIAIASGKGGTGKTMLAVALSELLGETAMLVDLDVEEPNADLFLEKRLEQNHTVTRMVPVIDYSLCNFCGVCAANCAFKALVVIPGEVMVFPELCHSCAACYYTCPVNAITKGQHPVGNIEEYWLKNGSRLITGRLSVGEAQSPPVIKQAKKTAARYWCTNTVLDCPPGTGCATLEAVKGSDYCILVTEPTPFGRHDLEMVLQAITLLNIPTGVVINRWEGNDAGIDILTAQYQMPVLERIPFSRDLAAGFTKGEHPINLMPELRNKLENILLTLQVTR